MKDFDLTDKNRFLYAKFPYHGQFTPNNFIFNANLQEFAHKVEYIAGLHSNGKLSSETAYEQIQDIWQQLKTNYQKLQKYSEED